MGPRELVRRASRAAARARQTAQDLRARIWFRPVLWMLLTCGGAAATVTLDVTLAREGLADALPAPLDVDLEGARALLGAIVSAMLTVTSLAFSLVMVVIVQTSNAYSPRLLRDYLGDARNQHSLGLLTGTFLYSLIVLRSLGAAGGSAHAVSVNVAVLLAVTATVALVLFLNRVAESVKVSDIVARIVVRTRRELERPFPAELGQPWDRPEPPALPDAAPTVVTASGSGHLRHVDGAALVSLGDERGLIVLLHHRVGEFVLEGTPLASLWGVHEVDDALVDAVRGACLLGSERTYEGDVRFGLRQLTDVALRALSPGINDPGTAVSTVLALTSLLARLAPELPSRWRCNDRGDLRVVVPETGLRELLDETLVHVLQYARGDVLVLRRLALACGQLRARVGPAGGEEPLWDLLVATHAAAGALEEAPARRAAQEDAQAAARAFGRTL